MSISVSARVVQVAPSHIHAVWPHIEYYIERSVSHSYGDVGLEEVKHRLLSGEWVLYVVIHDNSNMVVGAVVVTYYNRINDRVAYVAAIGGEFITNQGYFSQLCDVLKYSGATCIEGAVRESMSRLLSKLGFKRKSINIKFDLR